MTMKESLIIGSFKNKHTLVQCFFYILRGSEESSTFQLSTRLILPHLWGKMGLQPFSSHL